MRARLGLDPHARYRELLAGRLDRPLTRAENRLLVDHLKACPDCQQAELDYQAQGSLLRSMPKPVPPRDMWARTSTALDGEVSRWSYRYPRFGRRAVVATDRRRRGGSPTVLASVVALLAIVTAVAALQLAPVPRPTQVANIDALGTVASFRPTPFAVPPQPLSFFAAVDADLGFYETSVDRVCPQSTFDCFDNDKEIVRRKVRLPSNMRPQNIALSPNGDQIAFVGHDAEQDVIAVVTLRSGSGSGVGPDRSPSRPPEPTPSPTVAPASATPTAVAESPSSEPAESQLPIDTSPPATAETPTASPSGPDTNPTPASQPIETPGETVDPSPPSAPESPPESVVPGLVVLSILEDVHSAGAPPAWSNDGEALAFSAMPADGSHGPDVYVWRPGDGQARAITTDHASYFASWAGRRIVASRINETPGKSDSADVLTIVIDPVSLEERRVRGPKLWLPVVDPQRAHAVAWHGSLDLTTELPTLAEGALYIVDWAQIDPFNDGATGPDQPDSGLVALDPTRDPLARPVIDWHVRWSADGRVLGVWEPEAAGSPWGALRLLGFDQELGQLSSEEPLVKLMLAKRGFSLGVDRVAYVGLAQDGTKAELRVRTWGNAGPGDLLIETLDLEELVPSF